MIDTFRFVAVLIVVVVLALIFANLAISLLT
jgi:hypothetical protein